MTLKVLDHSYEMIKQFLHEKLLLTESQLPGLVMDLMYLSSMPPNQSLPLWRNNIMFLFGTMGVPASTWVTELKIFAYPTSLLKYH